MLERINHSFKKIRTEESEMEQTLQGVLMRGHWVLS
jgi:hypothetical protein